MGVIWLCFSIKQPTHDSIGDRIHNTWKSTPPTLKRNCSTITLRSLESSSIVRLESHLKFKPLDRLEHQLNTLFYYHSEVEKQNPKLLAYGMLDVDLVTSDQVDRMNINSAAATPLLQLSESFKLEVTFYPFHHLSKPLSNCSALDTIGGFYQCSVLKSMSLCKPSPSGKHSLN